MNQNGQDKIITPDSFDPEGPQHFSSEEDAARFALEQTVARAHAGEPAAQYALALAILHFGDFAGKEENAIMWLKRAAAAGHVPSQLLLKDL